MFLDGMATPSHFTLTLTLTDDVNGDGDGDDNVKDHVNNHVKCDGRRGGERGRPWLLRLCYRRSVPAFSSEVESLIARGEYHAAARSLADEGDLEAAQALLERVWDFPAAAAMARARGDRVATMRLLLDGKDVGGASLVLADILERSASDELSAAADLCERRRLWREAAQLRERAGEPAAARELFARGGLLLEAARIDEQLGKLREAGMAFERALAGTPPPGEGARARLGLGRVLGLLGRHEESARQLQQALRSRALDEEATGEARKLLVISLDSLGLREGATHLLEEVRAADPALPSLGAFLARAARERGGGDLLAGRYRVVRLLGAGGMGRVYLARDRVTNEEVAVKVVPPPIEPRARDGYRRFLREARAVAGLSHPNVVAARDVFEREGLLVMEYVPGGTLETRAESGRPGLGMGPTASARRILLDVVAGLAAAHGRGILHRDVKPANVFFAATGEAKLGDFGAAHLQDLGATRTAGFVGTLAYMAPEQITAAPLTFACDVYALGVTAFQLLTGWLPFEGPDFVGQHLGEPAPAPSSRAGGGGVASPWAAWDRLVLRMLAKDPAARHGSLDELRRELEALPVLDGAAPETAPGSEPAHQAASPAPPPPAATARSDRYRVEAEIGATPVSTLHHAVDEHLARPVLLERFDGGAFAGDDGQGRMARLRGMARFAGPRLQRVLHLDPGERLAVYEAIAGTPALDLPRPVSRPAAARIVLDVLHALAPPHAAGVAHGSLDSSVILEAWGATVVIAGTSASAGALHSPAADIAALGRMVTAMVAPGDVPPGGSDAGALVAWARAAR